MLLAQQFNVRTVFVLLIAPGFGL